MNVDERFIIHVSDFMGLSTPRCRLPKPKMKPTILVTGWNEWLQIITVEAEA